MIPTIKSTKSSTKSLKNGHFFFWRGKNFWPPKKVGPRKERKIYIFFQGESDTYMRFKYSDFGFMPFHDCCFCLQKWDFSRSKLFAFLSKLLDPLTVFTLYLFNAKASEIIVRCNRELGSSFRNYFFLTFFFHKKFEKWSFFFLTQKKNSDPKNSRTTDRKKKVQFFQGDIETYMHFQTFRFCIHAMVLLSTKMRFFEIKTICVPIKIIGSSDSVYPVSF